MEVHVVGFGGQLHEGRFRRQLGGHCHLVLLRYLLMVLHLLMLVVLLLLWWL